MGKIYEFKGYITKFYGKHSAIVEKILKFVLAFLVFTYVGHNIGFSEIASNPILSLILSVICMLLPLQVLMVLAMFATVIQIWTVSLGMAIVAIALYVVMYGFYFKYSADKAHVLLLMIVAFLFDVPIVIPIVFGLIGTPACIIPVSAGTIIHYMVQYVKNNASVFGAVEGKEVIWQSITYAKEFVMNKEMWCILLAFAVTLLLVYGVRRMSVDHSWEIAIIAGALGNINIMAYGYIIMEIKISYVSLIVGSIVAIIVALIVKLFAFSVDYTRTEYLQFEDDEYCYYLKAIPKVSVAIPEKTVKRINERQKTGVIDAEQVKQMEQAGKKDEEQDNQKEEESEIQRIIEEELKQEK